MSYSGSRTSIVNYPSILFYIEVNITLNKNINNTIIIFLYKEFYILEIKRKKVAKV